MAPPKPKPPVPGGTSAQLPGAAAFEMSQTRNRGSVRDHKMMRGSVAGGSSSNLRASMPSVKDAPNTRIAVRLVVSTMRFELTMLGMAAALDWGVGSIVDGTF